MTERSENVEITIVILILMIFIALFSAFIMKRISDDAENHIRRIEMLNSKLEKEKLENENKIKEVEDRIFANECEITALKYRLNANGEKEKTNEKYK